MGSVVNIQRVILIKYICHLRLSWSMRRITEKNVKLYCSVNSDLQDNGAEALGVRYS